MIKKTKRGFISFLLILFILVITAGCQKKEHEKVIIYTNADDEAITAIESVLDQNGFKDKYLLQSFATSELGGRMIAEGKKIEADLITMSSYYIDTAQKESNLFLNLNFERSALNNTFPSYASPITALEGTIIVNTQDADEGNIPLPDSLKALSDPIYSGKIAIPDITGSSTGWLLVQTIIDAYGEDEGAAIMSGLIKNAGPHMESSGSGPFKKVKAGEVAFAFGLRHQAVAAKLEGLPIDFISPKEGSYYLTESLAVVDKGKDTNTAETMAIAECIVKMGRPELIKTYPVPLYKGEINNQTAETVHSKTFSQPLTVDLLQTHQDFSERCKLKK